MKTKHAEIQRIVSAIGSAVADKGSVAKA